jgi:hypothetical protein
MGSQMGSTMCASPDEIQLGYLDAILGITSAVAVAAQSGISIYGTIEQLDLAKEQAKLQEELARDRAALEASLLKSQQKLADMRTTYYGQREEISIGLEETQAELLKEQLRRDALIKEQEQEAALIRALDEKQQAIDTGEKSIAVPVVLGVVGVALAAILLLK